MWKSRYRIYLRITLVLIRTWNSSSFLIPHPGSRIHQHTVVVANDEPYKLREACKLSHPQKRVRTRTFASPSPPYLLDDIQNQQIQDLPIYKLLDSIQSSLQDKPNLLLEASPGAGKTTIVPLSLAFSGNGGVIVVEPRRVATRSAAQRMSALLRQTPGQTVGYSIRGESKRSAKTEITVMTDGVLLNKLRNDPELKGVGTVILDEFHERGIGSDTVLALCREVQINFRPDLRLVVMSATLLGGQDEAAEQGNNGDVEESAGVKLLRTLGGTDQCNVLQSEGRQYPITIQHSKRSNPLYGALKNDPKLLIKTMADAIEEGLLRAPSKGDVLAFLPGVKEIRKVMQELKSRRLGDGVDIYPLYGALPKQEQDAAIFPSDSDGVSPRRRIVVSSPIAEASLTIEGVTCVVDSGFRREPRYDVSSGLPRLVTVSISKDSAKQRAGRAGRTQDGYCIRLFSEGEYTRLPMHAMPEICSTDLVPTTLLLSQWGCLSADEILEDIPFVDAPPKHALEKAYGMLIDLESLEEYTMPNSRQKQYRVTSHGRKLASLPTHPRFASSIVRASETNPETLAAAVIVAALMDEENNKGRRDSNLANQLLEVLQNGEMSYSGRLIMQYASRLGSDARQAVLKALNGSLSISQVTNQLGQALLPGFIDLIAQRKGDASYGGSTYMLSLGRSARLDSKRDEGDYIIVVDTSTSDDGKTRIRAYAKIDLETLKSVAVEKNELYTVPSRGYEVRAKKILKVGALELSSSPLPSPAPSEITAVLLDKISALGGVHTALMQNQPKKNMPSIKEIQQRVRLARKLTSNEDWPACFAALDATSERNATYADEEILISLVEPWLSAARSIKGIDMYQILQSSLSPVQQAQLRRDFPRNLQAPDGSSVPLNYDNEAGPVASGKLQQFFGATESPQVGPSHNAVPVSLSLLSPSGKPLANTIDLPFFWKVIYPDVRSEMRGRYPKHPWPEDPMNAEATRFTKKQQALKKPTDDVTKVDKRKERGKKRKNKK